MSSPALAHILRHHGFTVAGGSLIKFSAPLIHNLNKTHGKGNYNFSSDAQGQSTFIPYDGGVVDCKAHEARFDNMRRVENMLPTSDPRQWTLNGIGTVTDGIADPFGGNEAFEITPISEQIYAYHQMTGHVYSFQRNTLWMRSAGTPFTITLLNGSSGLNGIPVTVTNEWQRYDAGEQYVAGISKFFGYLSFVGAQPLQIAYGQAEDVSSHAEYLPSEYVSHGSGTGPESSPDVNIQDTSSWDTSSPNITFTLGAIKRTGTGVLTELPYSASKYNVNRLYAITWTLANYSSGNAQIGVGDTVGAVRTANGTYTEIVRTASTNGLYNVGAGTYDITYVSIKEIDHGANVDGVKYFSYTNPNTVTANIVNPTGAATTPLTSNGILLEPQRTNLVINTDNMSAFANNLQTTISAKSAAQDFTVTANNATSAHYIGQQGSVTVGTAYTQRFRVKAGTVGWIQCFTSTAGFGTANWFNVNLSTGAITNDNTPSMTKSVELKADGFYEVTMTMTATGTSTAAFFVMAILNSDLGVRAATWSAAGTETVVVKNWQMEAGAFATSYIPTTTSTVTRTKDSLRYNVANLNQSAGSFYLEFTATGLNPAFSDMVVDFNGSVGGIYLSSAGAISIIDFLDPAPTSTITAVDGGTYKIIVSWDEDAGILTTCVNGETPVTVSGWNGWNAAFNKLVFLASGNHSLTIKDTKSFFKALSAAKMQELTS